MGQWKWPKLSGLYIAVNVSDSKEVSDQDTDSDVVECESFQDCICRSVSNATVYTVIMLHFENISRYLDVAI